MPPAAPARRRARCSVLLLIALAAGLSCVRGPAGETPGFDLRREAAYRTNNRGVALLEQQRPAAAAEAFRDALDAYSALRLAAINLPIALYYAGNNREAAEAAAAARASYPDALQPLYLLGLIAQEENRLPEALAAFGEILKLDPDDVGTRVHLARVQIQLGSYEAAIALCEEALAREPYNATAAYNLTLALTRSGDRAAGARAAARFQELTTAAYGVTYSRSYLEQGRYAEALSSTGLEADLVDAAPPDVTFAGVTAGFDPQPPSTRPGARARGITLADLDDDGDLDLIVTGGAVRVFQNDRMQFRDVTAISGIPSQLDASGSVVGDIDNDGTADVLLLADDGGAYVLSGTGGGRFASEPSILLAGDAPGVGARTAALSDVDHDGDLDILVGSTPPDALGSGRRSGDRTRTPVRLFRNNRNGTYDDITADAGLDGVTEIVAMAPTDFDNRRDIDLLMVPHGERPKLFRNLRTGSFTDVAASAGLPGAGDYTSLSLGDVNKDGWPDFFFGRQSGPGLLAASRTGGALTVHELPAATAGAMAAQLFDYDHDGLLDLLVGGASGLRLLRNIGNAWDEPAHALADVPAAGADIVSLATGDLDGDGDLDIIAGAADGSLHVLRNDGGTRNGSLHVALRALVSNRGGVGSKVEVRAGSLYQRVETAAATPSVRPSSLLFGLGGRRGADVVRILWPAGILQAETIPPESTPRRAIAVEELDRKPSSCPYLFVWNGTQFVFVTDFLGGGEMGYWQAPGVRNVPDPVEYVRIAGDQLRPRNGRFELRVTNELEEVLFLDQLRLLAVTHPADAEVFPDEGLRATERPFRMYAVRNIQPVARAWDDHGHDVRAVLSALDRRAPDDFARLPIRGYAREHGVVLELPPMRPSASERVVLLLTGWTDYAFSRDNVAAHQAGHSLLPPVLQQQSTGGIWETVEADVGIPVGRPQTLVVDVTAAARRGRPLRLATTMRIYWDQIRVGLSTTHSPEAVQVLPPAAAALRWRGYSAPVSPDGREPFSYDYARVSEHAPWKLMPGRFTREGDVRELIGDADDRHVISRTGDELAVAFDASALPPLPDGVRRTYLLHATGYSKEMDVHSASPDQAAPVPFRAMSEYPYSAPEAYPHPEDFERFHTRVVSRPLPPLDRPAGDSTSR